MTITPPVIGLSGYARAGKDTLAALLAQHGYQRRSFAAPLKDALYRLNPTVPWVGVARTAPLQQVIDLIGWEQAKDDVPEIRALLQRLGTDVGRVMFGQDFWVEQAFRTLDGVPLAVFSDVRFPNEADACKAAGGQVWRIERPGCGPVNGHPSETAMDRYDFDQVIVNWGSVEDLGDAVGELLGARPVGA